MRSRLCDLAEDRIKLEYPTRMMSPFYSKRARTALPVSSYTPSTRKNRLHTFRQMGKSVLNGFGRRIGVAALPCSSVLEPLDGFSDMRILGFGTAPSGSSERRLGIFTRTSTWPCTTLPGFFGMLRWPDAYFPAAKATPATIGAPTSAIITPATTTPAISQSA